MLWVILLTSTESERPNHDTQCLFDEQWGPISSQLLLKGNSTNLEDN